MGERLGVIESLTQQGITPISPDQGTATLQSIVAQPRAPSSLMVASRFKSLPDLPFERAEPPLARFLERTQLFVPGVELIADAKLSHASDPYLQDHVFERTPLLPAVMGMEAMAQAAATLSGGSGPLVWRDVAFEHPIIVSRTESATIRTYALMDPDGSVRVAIRSEEDGFQRNHFRARVRFDAARELAPVPNLPGNAPPLIDLYGSVLFQSGRFQRLLGYSHLTRTSCRSRLRGAAKDAGRWFGAYYPPLLLLGDPGVRDAAIHSIQGCIPDRTLVPQRVDEIRMFSLLEGPEGFVQKIDAQAIERSSCCSTFVYDLDLVDSEGRILEQWRGLTLHAVASKIAEPVAAIAH